MKKWKTYTTIAIDDVELKKRLKQRALDKDTTVLELVQYYIRKGLENE
jgi:hypothetical protein